MAEGSGSPSPKAEEALQQGSVGASFECGPLTKDNLGPSRGGD
jgi:hypothetical protein